MTAFLLGATALTVVTLALLLWPLRRQTTVNEPSRSELNAAIYRDELAELDRDLATGELSQADYDQAKAELQRRLLEDSKTGAGNVAAGLPANRATMIGLALFVPLGGALLYFLLGNPAALDAAATPHQQKFTPAEIERLVSDFAARLENEPENYKGWAMLGRSYKALGRFPEALRAYERTGPLLEANAELLVEYADVLAATEGFAAKTLAVLERALKLDPQQPQGLWLRGTAAFAAKQYDKAVADWEALLALLEPDSEDARVIEANIAEARQLGGMQPISRQSRKPGAAASAPAGGTAIKGRVEIASQVADKLPTNGVVMIVARPTDGSRMPVAVLRAPLGGSPIEFALDDGQAMSPDRKPSQFSELLVEARISQSGQAMPQPGDLFGPAMKVKQGARDVVLRIDAVRQ